MITRRHQTLTGESGAIFSDCEQYRYRLWREWNPNLPALCYLLTNPSKAGHIVNDPTVVRGVRRAAMLGFGRAHWANLFPWRATNPRELRTVANPLGPQQDADFAILDAVKDCQMIICGWGSNPALPERARHVLGLLATAGLSDRLHALQVNDDGQPGHPLYLSYDLKPVRYQP